MYPQTGVPSPKVLQNVVANIVVLPREGNITSGYQLKTNGLGLEGRSFAMGTADSGCTSARRHAG